MSSSKPVKKKIVVTQQSPKKSGSRSPEKKTKQEDKAPVEMLFKRKNYYFVLGGVLLIALGFILMSGGKMPSPEIWDESIIYNPRRTILAPIVILTGIALVLFSIFKK
jgi:hypothetical protein